MDRKYFYDLAEAAVLEKVTFPAGSLTHWNF
jgi:hypothetical protein